MAIRVLIVDDEIGIASAVQSRLEIEGHESVIVTDGQAAIEQVREEKPDLILLDVMIPKINGIEVCRALKKDPRTKDIPIIMLTVMNQVKDLEAAFAAGANDYLNKPFQFAQLLAKIDKYTK
jgi:CheY-like chemotaxis protein